MLETEIEEVCMNTIRTLLIAQIGIRIYVKLCLSLWMLCEKRRYTFLIRSIV